MSGSAQDTIRAAAEAYISGDAGALADQLHDEASVLGSEQRDQWSNRVDVMDGLEPELGRRQSFPGAVSGSLIDRIQECDDVKEMGDVALWSTTGSLELDGYYHRKASWTVVLERGEGESGGSWKIRHSHFSIHR